MISFPKQERSETKMGINHHLILYVLSLSRMSKGISHLSCMSKNQKFIRHFKISPVLKWKVQR